MERAQIKESRMMIQPQPPVLMSEGSRMPNQSPLLSLEFPWGRPFMGSTSERYMTLEEYDEYFSASIASDGFDVPPILPGVRLPGYTNDIKPIINTDLSLFKPLVDFAIKHHNRETGENLKLGDIIKCNFQGPIGYYITFTATDASAAASPPSLVYQTLVKKWFKFSPQGKPPGEHTVIIFRRRPETPAAAAAGPSSSCSCSC